MESVKINSVYGRDGRTFTYVSKGRKTSESASKSTAQNTFRDKIDYRKKLCETQKNWNHFDSNMNNHLVEQRKILYSKNYEIDSRAYGLKDYGVQPLMD